MSDEDVPEEEINEIPGEDGEGSPRPPPIFPEAIVEKRLSVEQASKCLNTLGKDESGMRYAYLMITATDRKLTDVSAILNFKHVLLVDVSQNLLSLGALQILTRMPFLVMLKAESNRIESSALMSVPFLQVLCLNRNQIMETSDIDQPMLEHLELSHNQLFKVEFEIEQTTTIKLLEMRGNFLPDLSGDYPSNVESLYLAENRICKIIANDLSKLAHLKILHLRENRIRKLNGFTSALTNLTYLNLRKNKIATFRQFQKLSCLPKLDTLIVSQNPVSGEAEEEAGEGGDEDAESEEEKEDVTRTPLLVLLPRLKRINKVPVTLEEREEVLEIRDEKLEEIMAEESSEDETEPPTTADLTAAYTSEIDEVDAND